MTELLLRPKILIVDDQPTNIHILAEALKDHYDVRIANNGEKALRITEETDKPDLILLDVMMPGLDGFEVCRRLKNDPTSQDIPIIFVTAKNNVVDEERGLNLGAVDYVSKPFSIPVIKARIHNQLLLKQRADLLTLLASIDPLTHLPNRRLFEKTLESEWKRAQREASPLSILLTDIDFFKRYNDNYGHGAGDICLQRVANSLQSAQSRPADLVARYGGEEFIVILPNTDEQGARVAAERLRERVEALQLAHGFSDVTTVVTVSVGCASLLPSHDDHDPGVLVHAADVQLYKAKELGRNRVA